MPVLLWIPIGIAAALVYAFGSCVTWIVAHRTASRWNEGSYLATAVIWPAAAIMLVVVKTPRTPLLIYSAAEWFVDKVLKIK